MNLNQLTDIHNRRGNIVVTEARDEIAKLKAINAEMLEALRTILAGNTMQGKYDYSLAEVIQQHYAICRAAIAKAEGQNR